MTTSEGLIPGDIGNRYWFWILANYLIVIPSSKKPASSEQIGGAKHVRRKKYEDATGIEPKLLTLIDLTLIASYYFT